MPEEVLKPVGVKSCEVYETCDRLVLLQVYGHTLAHKKEPYASTLLTELHCFHSIPFDSRCSGSRGIERPGARHVLEDGSRRQQRWEG